MKMIRILRGKIRGNGFLFWKHCFNFYHPALGSDGGAYNEWAKRATGTRCFKRGMLSLQWGMGDYRESRYDSGLFERKSDAGVLWEEGNLDADPCGVGAK